MEWLAATGCPKTSKNNVSDIDFTDVLIRDRQRQVLKQTPSASMRDVKQKDNDKQRDKDKEKRHTFLDRLCAEPLYMKSRSLNESWFAVFALNRQDRSCRYLDFSGSTELLPNPASLGRTDQLTISLW